MIKIEVKALTINALIGLKQHYKECNTFKNRLKLKAYGVTQDFNINKKTLIISYHNLILKLNEKIKNEKFKAMLKEDQKKSFIKTVDDFMQKQKVLKKEYEVNFKND